jgi:general secretion pathway protein K
VLWLSAALSAIAFSVATTVRGETERAATHADAVRSYYVAAGGIERALLYMRWGPMYRNPDGSPRFYEPGMPYLRLQFPQGEAFVEIVPEHAKFDLNQATPADLVRLGLALALSSEQAQLLAAGIIEWRTPAPPGAFGPPGLNPLGGGPTFRPRHASFEEIEELLYVRGMTPDIYHGRYERDGEGRLLARGSFRDCVSVYGSTGQFDVNTATPAVLAAIGFPWQSVNAIVQMRSAVSVRTPQQLAAFAQFGPASQRLKIGGGAAWTLRSTARLRLPDGSLSDLRRSVSALVRFGRPPKEPEMQVLRWYDNTWEPGL